MRQKSVESSLAPQGSFSRGWQWIRERRLPLLALALYLVAALWLTWPTVLSPLSEIPIGSEPVATVPLFAVWTMWWNADQLAGMFGNYWNAPIFFPTQDTFALSEPLPGTMIVAPVIWITGSRVLAYNLYLWTSLILNGVFAQRLLKLYGVGTSVAIWGSVAVVLLPIVNWQLGVVHLLSLWGILWTWAAIERMCDKPTRWRGVELGAALGVSAILSFHHGLFLGILLVAAAPTLWRCLIRYRDWPAWLLAVPVALIIAGPFAYPIHKTLQVHGTEWERAWIVEQSAQPSDYLQVYGTTAPNNSWRMLAPGWVKLGLAMIGIVFGIRNVAYRRWAACQYCRRSDTCSFSPALFIWGSSSSPQWACTDFIKLAAVAGKKELHS